MRGGWRAPPCCIDAHPGSLLLFAFLHVHLQAADRVFGSREVGRKRMLIGQALCKDHGHCPSSQVTYPGCAAIHTSASDRTTLQPNT